ncbi:MAG TPA: type II secretion system protein N, partial [Burkholderiales bacterium]|nr:type II secretion system protein N [Burkholderiales bacterium]
SLNVVLTGVMARGPSSFAFLSVNGAPEVFITIGEEITTGTTLETVYPDRVVLKRGATLESVLLKGNDIALPPGSIEGPGAEKIIGAVRPQQGGGAPPATATFDDVEPGRDVQLEEAPPEPAHIRNIPRPRTPGSMRR